MTEPIKSICPKCRREGIQSIFAPKKSNPNLKYLRFLHGKGDECYIGRIRNLGEGMGILNRPQSLEDYEIVMKDISSQLRDLAKYYSNAKSGSVVKIVRSIEEILLNYGF